MRTILGLLETSSHTWDSPAFDIALKVTIVLSTVAIACRVSRHASASLRHLILASGLAGAVAVPLLIPALPTWRVPIFPLAQPDPRPDLRDARPASAATRHSPRLAESGPTRDARSSGPRVTGVDPEARLATTPRPAARPLARSVAGLRELWIVAAWGVGAIVTLLPLLASHARLRMVGRRSSRVVDGPLMEMLEDQRSQLGISRRVSVLLGESTSSPMTWGGVNPVIFLPAGAEGWGPGRLRPVLLHELAHVKRWDCSTQVLARLACVVYWFHPLVWMAASRMRIESELACDDLVLRSGSRATDYAGHLLEVARTYRSSPGLEPVAVPMARPSQLEGRLRAILDGTRDRRKVSRRGTYILSAAVAIFLIPLAATRFGARAADVAEEPKAETAVLKRSDRSATMSVSGRVLDQDGRPMPGARVAVVGRRKLAMLNARVDDQHEVLGHTEADASGRFRLDVPRTSSVTHYGAFAMASAPGLGLGWAELNRDAESPSADVRLRAEQDVEGRLVDLQGAPADGVVVSVSGVGVVKKEVGGYDGLGFGGALPKGLEGVWPESAKTDADGQFRLSGVGRGVRIGLRVDDPRFARQEIGLETDEAGATKRATLALQPAMRVRGRVTRADTGEPLRDTVVVVGSGSDIFNTGGSNYRTDADGRYEANPPRGSYVKVTVYPAVGSPYPVFERNFDRDDDAAGREVDVAVPRGVLLTGLVTERGGARPLADAAVFYENGRGNVVEGEGPIPGWMAAVATDAAGRYAIAVTPGKGHLLVYGPTADFVHEVKASRELSGGNPGGRREYAHAFLPYEVKAGQAPVEIDAALKPGVTVFGRVVGPDGKAVETAEIVTTLSISPFHTSWRGDFTIPVREGRFELHGVSPDRPVKCSFLDAKHGLGTSIVVTAAMATAGPLTIELKPCGAAIARLIDEDGRPVAKDVLNLSIVGTPGPGTDYDGETLTGEERAMLAADEELYANVDRLNYWEGPRSDGEGRITLPKLIPGATYRIYEDTRGKAEVAHRWRDFTVESGQTVDLGDVRRKGR